MPSLPPTLSALSAVRSRALGVGLFVAAIVSAVACGSNEVVAPGPSADAGTGASADAPSSAFVLVSPDLGAAGERIDALVAGPSGSLLVQSSGAGGHALHRLDAEGVPVWTRPLGAAALVATAGSDRIVIADPSLAVAGGAKAPLVVIDGMGKDVRRIAMDSDVVALGSAGEGVFGLVRSGAAPFVFSWDGAGATVTEAALVGGPAITDRTFAVDGKGVGWATGENGLVRIERSGATTTLPIPTNGSAPLVGRPNGGVLAVRTERELPYVAVGPSGEVEAGYESRSADGALDFALAATTDERHFSFGLYSRPAPAQNAASSAYVLAIVDMKGKGLKDIGFSYRASAANATFASGKLWIGGGYTGKLSLGAKTLVRGPAKEDAPWLLGFDRLDTIKPLEASVYCRGVTDTCDTCHRECDARCTDAYDCPANDAFACACRAPEAFRECLGSAYSAAITAKFVACYADRCAEACGVTR